MAENYNDLRNALAAKPTKGPWKAGTGNAIGPISYEDDQSYGMILPVAFVDIENCEVNRKYIAAANPETVASLLAERDYYANECNEQARLLGISAERELKLMAERDALWNALDNLLKVHEGVGGTKFPADEIARAALEKGKQK